jgi:hypothetical protein
MATGMASRLAGKALNDFFKASMGAVSSAAQQKTLGYLLGKSDYADAPGIAGKIASNPELISRMVGAAAPVGVAGGITGLGLLAKNLRQPSTGYSQSGYSLPVQKIGTPVAFANQQYFAGASPMTNQAAAEALLEQQKFQHQLQLIEARQAAATRQGSLSPSAGVDMNNILELATKIYG